MMRINQKVTCLSDMDMDEDDSSLLEPALAIDDGAENAYDLDVPPTTGNEYLRRVREEAKKCPKVVVADVDTSAFKHRQTVRAQPKDTMTAPKGYSPNAEWVKIQVASFVTLRQKLAHYKSLLAQKKVDLPEVKLPLPNDMENWCRLCFGRLQVKNKTDMQDVSQASDPNTKGSPPFLRLMARMDQPTVIKVLEYHVNWLEATGFSHNQGQWFYALLANLQKPLTPESCAWLRQLARICSIVRATLQSPEDEMLPELNLLICLVAHYFDQKDLADKT